MLEFISLYRSKSRASFRWMLVVVLLSAVGFGSFSWLPIGDQRLLTNVVLDQVQLANMTYTEGVELAEKLIRDKNEQTIHVSLNGIHYETIPLSQLGLEYSTDSLVNQLQASTKGFFSSLFGVSATADEPDALQAQLLVHPSDRDAYFSRLLEFETIEPQPARYQYVVGKGWKYFRAEKGTTIPRASFERGFETLLDGLQYGVAPLELRLQRQIQTPRQERLAILTYQRILNLVRDPIVFRLGAEERALDLNAEEDFVIIDGEQVMPNEKKIRDWIQALANEVYRAPSMLRIVGVQEAANQTQQAVVDGEEINGLQIRAGKLFRELLNRISERSERVLEVELEEIPVQVYSELDQSSYQVLGIGYSEYSKGNDINRVHNVKTGLGRLNHKYISSGSEVSFNRLVGNLSVDFVEGYGIFGSVAGKIQAGGLCQVSTTFYRGLLNLGVPITMRRNHSWDLSYYREGGYGLDATVFPSAGLDVKGINDYNSPLFIRSFVNSETEEAYVIFYGLADGRQVTLAPRQDYQFYYGPKTLVWDQKVVYSNGREREDEIVSRYNR